MLAGEPRAGHALLARYPRDAPGFLSAVGWKEREDGGVSLGCRWYPNVAGTVLELWGRAVTPHSRSCVQTLLLVLPQGSFPSGASPLPSPLHIWLQPQLDRPVPPRQSINAPPELPGRAAPPGAVSAPAGHGEGDVPAERRARGRDSCAFPPREGPELHPWVTECPL